jgi:hypothetical protein
MDWYTEHHAEQDRLLIEDGRMQEGAKQAARIRLWIHELKKGSHEN